jgi:hypothetical protein
MAAGAVKLTRNVVAGFPTVGNVLKLYFAPAASATAAATTKAVNSARRVRGALVHMVPTVRPPPQIG